MEEVIKEGFIRVSKILDTFRLPVSIPKDIYDNARERGIRLHNAFHQRITKGCIFQALQEQDLGYMQSWEDWYEDGLGVEKNICLTETRIYDTKKPITGKIDGVWEKEGKNYLIDWKCTSVEDKTIWPIQMAAYSQLIKRSNLCKLEDTAFILKLNKEGGDAKLIPIELTDFHFKTWDRLVALYGSTKNDRQTEEE
jgi:hypothetical protein